MNAVAHRNHIRQTKASRIFDVCNAIFMLFLVAITLYPFWYVAIISLSDGKAVLAGKVVLWPVDFTLESYKLALSDASILCAYPLSRPKFIGKGVVMKMIVFTMFFSGGMIPTYLVVNQLNMIDTIWAMILPGAISTYNMIVIRTFFMSIPESLNESASLDGANDLQILLRIVIPCSLPIIATMLLFYAVGHWNSYMNALLYLNKKALQPLQSILRNMVVDGQLTGSTTDVGGGSSFAVIETTLKYSVIIISTLPILLIYPFVQKYFVKGVMIGSVKG